MKQKRIVVKIGTSGLTHENGNPNLRRLDGLARTISDLKNAGNQIVLVSSGAVGVGMGKLHLKQRPEQVRARQAVAAVGQCELMFLYDKIFSEYNTTVAQVLLTKDVVDGGISRQNVENTLEELLSMGIVPIVNENDTVATDELEGLNFGDNDCLSAIVSILIDADLLVILTDTEGLYDKDPRRFVDASLIPVVKEINGDIIKLAGGRGSSRGTGGMYTKVLAAKTAAENGICTIVAPSENPAVLYDVLEGKPVGTKFLAKGESVL